MTDEVKTETTDPKTQLEKETDMVFGLINDALLKVEWAEACRDGAALFINTSRGAVSPVGRPSMAALAGHSETSPYELLHETLTDIIGGLVHAAEVNKLGDREIYLTLLQAVKQFEPEGICEDCKKAAMSGASACKADTPWHQQPGKCGTN